MVHLGHRSSTSSQYSNLFYIKLFDKSKQIFGAEKHEKKLHKFYKVVFEVSYLLGNSVSFIENCLGTKRGMICFFYI